MSFPSSSPLADARRFFRKHSYDTITSASSGPYSPPPLDYYSPTDSDSHSSCSSTSISSSSSRIRTLLSEVKALCMPSRTGSTRWIEDRPELSHSPIDSDDVMHCLPTGDTDSECPSPWATQRSNDCECTSRSTCPHCIQRHIQYLQSHEWRCVPRSLISAYQLSADEYANAGDALCLPEAKLARARAEYEWATAHLSDSTRLWAPRFQQRLLAAEAKVSTAEKEFEAANIRRRERAQLLMEIGRF